MNIAFYFSRPLVPAFEFGNIFGTEDKWPVYQEFLNSLKSFGFNIYFVSAENHLHGKSFKNSYFYDGANFIFQSNPVEVDILFDKSRAKHTPPKELSEIIYNSLEFKKVCQKDETQKFLESYMPKSVLAQNPEDLMKILKEYSSQKKLVVKPVNGLRGQGIMIATPKHLLTYLPQSLYPYLIQTFIDTSQGIEGITETYHDLRVIAANGKIIMAVLRTPPFGSLLANVSRGGAIQEIPLAAIPKSIFSFIQEVFQKIEHDFPGSFYSMDFGVENGKPYLFELNDRIGFPRESMPSAKILVEELVKALKQRLAT